MNRRKTALTALVLSALALSAGAAWAERQAPRCSDEMSALLLQHARRHGVPIDLLHRIVIRESMYNPAARNHRYYGLMQISYATARSMGYRGDPNGLLDANTNLTYAVPYLANAYMLSHGSNDRAVRLYASGYYATAKQEHMIASLRTADSPPLSPVRLVARAEAPRNPVSQLFGILTGSSASAQPVAADAREPAQAAASAPQGDPKDKTAKDKKAEKLAKKMVASAKTAHAPALAKAEPSAPVAEKVEVAAAAAKPAGDELRGSVDRVPQDFKTADAAPAATAQEALQPAVPAAKDAKRPAAKVRLASAKAAKKAAAKTQVAEQPEFVGADEAQGAPDAAAAEPDVKASAKKTHRSKPARTVVAAAKTSAPADDGAAAAAPDENGAAHVTKAAKTAKPKLASRHANAVLQAAASKTEVEPPAAADQ